MRFSLMAFLISIAFLSFYAFAATAQDKENTMTSTVKTALFAGGCFWCLEPPFEKMDGVHDVLSGYAGGKIDNPSYEQVSSGRSGHREVVEVRYDPKKISYETLLEIFWRNIDPFDAHGQFCDKGEQYTSAIYTATDEEREAAYASKIKMEKQLGKKIVTEIIPSVQFWPAEDYHQDYYKKNPIRYKFYRGGCKRDKRLNELWGDEARADHITP